MHPAVVVAAFADYHQTVTMEDVWGVLKWVLAALAAGFIGQFGKSFALRLIHRRQTSRVLDSADNPSGQSIIGKPGESPEQTGIREQAKIEKKRAKAQAKIEKKSKDGG